MEKATAGLELVDDVPVVTPLTDGAVGVADGETQRCLAYSLVMQAASLHSPAELVVIASRLLPPRRLGLLNGFRMWLRRSRR